MDERVSLDPAIAEALGQRLPEVAARTIDEVAESVPEYGVRLGGAVSPELRQTLESSVRLALRGFLDMVEQTGGAKEPADAGTPLRPVLEAAYALGRGEARSGRTMSALLAAYRAGARVAWREWASHAVQLGMPAAATARFAELVFAYVDALSAASVTGHSDELAVSGRVREQYRERLARALLDGEPEHALVRLAQRAEWEPPEALTVVVLPPAQARFAQPLLPQGTLQLPADVAGVGRDGAVGVSGADAALDVMLVPGGVTARRSLVDVLRNRPAVVGPARPWTVATSSFARAVRLLAERGLQRGVLDTEEHLTELVLGADPDALRDLRARALAPLDGERPQTRDRLVETLRSWLLHQGRRDEVAADLVVHPQTVRYRMTQLRKHFGDTLTDPRTVLELTVALGVPPAPR